MIEKKNTNYTRYQVQEQDPFTNEWVEIVNDVDDVLEFTSLGEAKEFVDYLKRINDTLTEKENVVYEV